MQRLQMIALAMFGAMAVAAHAQSSGGPYRIDSVVVASGGAMLNGGAFRLSGTVGQPATSMLGASSYRLYDGFWVPTSPLSDLIFANGFDP